jgi:hypothetical protein
MAITHHQANLMRIYTPSPLVQQPHTPARRRAEREWSCADASLACRLPGLGYTRRAYRGASELTTR